MSRTEKGKAEKIAKGLTKQKVSRQGYVIENSTLTSDASSEVAIKQLEEFAKDQKIGLERINSICQSCIVILKQMGRPFFPVIWYLTGDLSNPLPNHENGDWEFYRNKYGKQIGCSMLHTYFEKIGFGKLDDEYLLAKLIQLCNRVMENDKQTDIIEDAYQIGKLTEQLSVLMKSDARVSGRRKRKSLVPEIKRVLYEGGFEMHYLLALSQLVQDGVCSDSGDMVIWEEGKMTIESFRRRVHEQAKLLKNSSN